VDVAEFNDRWLAPPRTGDWGQLIIEHTAETTEVVSGVPASGVWRLAGDGAISLVRRECRARAIADETEALFIRTVDDGRAMVSGRCLGRLLTRGRLLTDDWRLSPRAQAWVQGVRQQFAAPLSAKLARAS
jgi:hypothetical protein